MVVPVTAQELPVVVEVQEEQVGQDLLVWVLHLL